MKSIEFFQNYERQTNSHVFDNLLPLIAENAIFWFGDGSHVGHPAIRKAFEATWTTIKDEVYSLREIICIGECEAVAAYAYTYHWKGLIEGRMLKGSGRGTSILKILNGGWQVAHEHLSTFPTVQPKN